MKDIIFDLYNCFVYPLISYINKLVNLEEYEQ